MDKKTKKKLVTLYKALDPRKDVDGLNVSRKEGEKDLPLLKIASMHWYNDWKTTSKVRRKTDYSHQKQYRQHKYWQNKNNQKIKIEWKTTVWTFQATNKQNFTRENLDMPEKGKPWEKLNVFWEQLKTTPKGLCQRKNRQDSTKYQV